MHLSVTHLSPNNFAPKKKKTISPFVVHAPRAATAHGDVAAAAAADIADALPPTDDWGVVTPTQRTTLWREGRSVCNFVFALKIPLPSREPADNGRGEDNKVKLRKHFSCAPPPAVSATHSTQNSSPRKANAREEYGNKP